MEPLVGSGPGGTTVSGASIAGANPLDFTISSDGSTGQVVTHNTYCIVNVAFTPTAAYERHAELVIADGSQRGERRLALYGYAYGPPGAMASATAIERSAGVQLRWNVGSTGGRPLEYVEVLRGEIRAVVTLRALM